MLSKFSLLTLLAVSIETVVAANDNNFKLYAYGTGIQKGLRLFYGDGQAYIGDAAPKFLKEAVNITLTTNKNSTEFIATPDSTIDENPASVLCINTTEGAVDPVSFVRKNETLKEGTTVVGFGLYGGWAFHKKEEADVEMNFVATPTNETGIYQIKWNASGAKTPNAISISLRTAAPSPLDH